MLLKKIIMLSLSAMLALGPVTASAALVNVDAKTVYTLINVTGSGPAMRCVYRVDYYKNGKVVSSHVEPLHQPKQMGVGWAYCLPGWTL